MRTLKDIVYGIKDEKADFYQEVAVEEDIKNLVSEIVEEIEWMNLKLLKVVTKEDLREYLNKKFNLEE